MLENSPYGVATYNQEGNCTYVNEALCKIIGSTRTLALSQNFHQILSWRKSCLYELAIFTLQTGKTQEKELDIFTTFDKEIHAECKLISFKANGQVNLLFIINDITEKNWLRID
jgi:PAS domain S-box-containing protein